ncbi:GNAT family N-acetyltransferase [Williamsia deligens]|uniref:GNAT family N-acetyltransferase n=1 Tax=Williamsia deligens TaxID=321325 RepID=A0ABW3GAT6_9NOCA|nr:GNAT family N-acetyltransferase [Williamsia deligens]MCP2193207.1 Acetyltransferase (GNAT) domain-containing protein [Williamsia deligens]
MTTRLASDPHEVAALRCEWAHERDHTVDPHPDQDFTEAVGAWMDNPSRTVWTARGVDDAVGMVCLTEYTRMPSPSESASGRWGYLGHLYVRPEARGAGAGEALVRTLLAESARRGHTKVVLSPTARSIPLYERCGFTAGNDLMIRHP